MRRNAAIFATLVGLLPPAAAHAVTWTEVEAVVRPALAKVLTPDEIDRLLARDNVRRALFETLDGWDGRHDRLVVGLGAGGDLELRAVLGAARTSCTTTLSRSESGASEPLCTETVDEVARGVDLGRDLWLPAPRPRPRPRPPRPPSPPPFDPMGDAPPSDTVVRRIDIPPFEDPHGPEVTEALRDWSDFQGGLGGRHWQDPFLPKDLTESGTALIEPPKFNPLIEEGMTANLRNPFDESRMGALLDIPAPTILSLSRDVSEAPLIETLDDACVADWKAEVRTTPPDLRCFRAFTQNARLDKGLFYNVKKALSVFGFNFSNPVLDMLVAIEMRDAASHRAYNVVWAAVWIDFVTADPDARLAASLGSLTEEERRFLRRRLWRWWIERDLRPYRALITSIYEQHFVALYPEAKDNAGLPKRAFFNNTWLWVSNWLSEVGRLPDETVTAAYGRLGTRERRVIDAFVADSMVAQRFPGPCALLSR